MATMIRLARAMFARADHDALPRGHQLRAAATELQEATERHFDMRPPDLAKCQWVDAYIRAYAAWRVYTGSDDVSFPAMQGTSTCT